MFRTVSCLPSPSDRPHGETSSACKGRQQQQLQCRRSVQLYSIMAHLACTHPVRDASVSAHRPPDAGVGDGEKPDEAVTPGGSSETNAPETLSLVVSMRFAVVVRFSPTVQSGARSGRNRSAPSMKGGSLRGVSGLRSLYHGTQVADGPGAQVAGGDGVGGEAERHEDRKVGGEMAVVRGPPVVAPCVRG